MTNRILRLVVVVASLGAGACCGDTVATLQVHVVDGETGLGVADPLVSVDGQFATCGSGQRLNPLPPMSPASPDAPASTDDGGTIVPAPGGADLGIGPPPGKTFCETFVAYLDPGRKTVHIVAANYFGTDVQVDLGGEGGAFSCPSPRDAEITVALYQQP